MDFSRIDIERLFNGIANTIRTLYKSYCRYDEIDIQIFIDSLKAVDKMELYLKGDFETLRAIEEEESRIARTRYDTINLMEQGLLPSLPPSPTGSVDFSFNNDL